MSEVCTDFVFNCVFVKINHRPINYDFFPVDHMGERPHKCTICGETFKHLIVLKRHVNVIHMKIKQTW